jgi:hypothetical protein
MGQLVFQATLGGQVNLVGPNTASTFNLNVPAVSSTIATLTGTETFTNKTLTSPTLTTPVLGTPASGTLTNCTSLPVGGITATGTPSSTTFLRGDSTWATITATTPGGSTTQVQYNSSGSFAGSANMTFSGTALTLANDASISGLTVGKGANDAQSTAVGNSVLSSNASGFQNVGVGYQALKANTTGYYNNAIGTFALTANTTGNFNNAMGRIALYSNTTGSNNTAIGQEALQANTTASNNTAVGYQALYANTTGTENTAVGHIALTANTTGSQNVAIGKTALVANTTGNNNIAIGWYANNYSTTGSYITAIGYNAYPNAVSDTNELIISCVTGGTGGKGTNTGFITVGSGGIYQGNNSTLWSITSDQRLKKNIVDHTEGLEKIVQLRVRNFEYRLPEEITELDSKNAVDIKGVQLGLIAQELTEVLPDCVKTESTGVMSVDATNITWHMINAIKDLKALNDALTARIVALESK